MKNYITITERNIPVVLGKINRFLRQSTCRDDGIRNVVVGRDYIDIAGDKIACNKYEKRRVFTLFVGGAQEHPTHKNLRTSPSEAIVHNIFSYDTVPAIVINDKYEDEGLCLFVGNKIFIDGHMMRIVLNDMYWVSKDMDGENVRVPKRDKAQVIEFYHMSYDSKAMEERIRHAAKECAYNIDESNFNERLIDDDPSGIMCVQRTLFHDIDQNVTACINKMDVSQPTVSYGFSVSSMVDFYFAPKREVTLHLNIDMLRNGLPEWNELDKTIWFVCDGQKFTRTAALVSYLLKTFEVA